jgi:hypothetical protein
MNPAHVAVGKNTKSAAVKTYKENIEQRPATRCFPEGRKSYSNHFCYRQTLIFTLAKNRLLRYGNCTSQRCYLIQLPTR